MMKRSALAGAFGGQRAFDISKAVRFYEPTLFRVMTTAHNYYSELSNNSTTGIKSTAGHSPENQ